MVALVSTEVTSPHNSPASAGPTSMGERRSRALRRVPSTQATWASVRETSRCRSSARCAAACTVARLAGAAVRVGLAPLEQRALAAAAPQRVGHPARDVGRPHQHVGERSVLVGEPAPVVEHPRPDAIAHQIAQLITQVPQGLELVTVALVDQCSGRRHQGAHARRP